jgi:hypothetical protein
MANAFQEAPPLLLPRFSLALTLALLCWLAPGTAGAQERRPTALYAQLALGPAYLNNRTAEHSYTENDYDGPGLSGQAELGLRLLRVLSLQTLLLLDYGAPEERGLTPLYRTGLGLGATIHVQGFQLALAAGAQLTWYMNYVDDPAYASGADLGPFGSVSAGYALPVTGRWALGVHLLARYHHSTDDYMGTQYEPQGITLGLLASVAYLGRELLP